MCYLHESFIGSHGHLKPTNCVIDARYVLKVSDYGLTRVRMQQKPVTKGDCDIVEISVNEIIVYSLKTCCGRRPKY